jgi:pimeloyl-ACP methyl ester carboxylesterase
MRPLLVFLHGFGEDARIWHDFLPERFAEFNSHIPNFAAWTDCSSIADYARKIIAQIPEKEQIVLIGHSMGGYIALEMAQQFPERIRGVIMLHSTILADSTEKKWQREKTARFILEHGSETFIKSFVSNLFAPTFVQSHQKLMDQLILRYQDLDANGLVAATLAMKDRQDFQQFIQFTSTPFLSVLGEIDPLIPPASILEIVAGKDQHKLVILSSVAHQGCYEAPEQTYEAISQFISEIHV